MQPSKTVQFLKSFNSPLLFSKHQEKPSSKIEAGNSSRKSDNLRGCDLLQEVSVTIRRFKKTSISKERLVDVL